MSPSALISGAPQGGLIRSSTAVSSRPWARTDQWVLRPASAPVTSSVPKIVAPVTYMTLPESNGSIEMSPIIQPSLGVPWKSRYGAPEVSSTIRSPIECQVSPPSTERKTSSTGPHLLIVETITVPGLRGSVDKPAYPNPASPPVL